MTSTSHSFASSLAVASSAAAVWAVTLTKRSGLNTPTRLRCNVQPWGLNAFVDEQWKATMIKAEKEIDIMDEMR